MTKTCYGRANDMVYQIFVSKKQCFSEESERLKAELKVLLGIEPTYLRIFNKYDVENVDKSTFKKSVSTVFSEPQTDEVFDELPVEEGQKVFVVSALAGQFDQRADSAAQCIQLISQRERPLVKWEKVFVLGGVDDEQAERIQKYVVNPVDSAVVPLAKYKTLKQKTVSPDKVEVLDGFVDMDDDALANFIEQRGLAMDVADLKTCRDYFKKEKRNPTVTEIKVLDTYWSDHCRHTTFNTVIDEIVFEDEGIEKEYKAYLDARKEAGRKKPVTLMDIGTIAAKILKKHGLLDNLDESEEINACTVKIKVKIDGVKRDWLLLFKNETHNHPTEIEPFGGAATCIGGAIRDPLSGRAYVYSAMRVTGAGNPLTPVKDTLKGKLPQRKIVTTAADGYSSYGNQIGLTTGLVQEIYHSGYVAKRMEVGAVIGAAPADRVRRERPIAGDKVILLGGKTGRDGCGGATGSSKSHSKESLAACGAEVQKGNAPEERKLQRLFRNRAASLMIKRCNDFGAGGVSVAIGELADGLDIDLNAVPKKYDGLDGTELAISESQERMAVVVAEKDVKKFLKLAKNENLEATVVATVTDANRLKMKWNGKYIVDLSREFLATNGAAKHATATVKPALPYQKQINGDFIKSYTALAGDLNVCSQKGLCERFDGTIGAGTVLMPFGGKYQATPIQAMVTKISTEKKETDTSSVMAFGFNPYIAQQSPFDAGYLAVVESVSKLVAVGAEFKDVYLSFQEYFEKLRQEPARWGKPVAALLGAFKAQRELGVAAIGGKDSMSGSFEKLDVPPTLLSFAVTTTDANYVIGNEFKEPFHRVVLLSPDRDERGLPTAESLLKNFDTVSALIRQKKVVTAYTPTYGGVAEAVLKMCLGNKIGFRFRDEVTNEVLFRYDYGAFVLELADNVVPAIDGKVTDIGYTARESSIVKGDEEITLDKITRAYDCKLASVFPTEATPADKPTTYSYFAPKRVVPKVKTDKIKALIPVFPGTNCEYDTAKAFAKAGATPEIFVINNLTPKAVSDSVRAFAKQLKQSQILFIPGGFSGGDEPDGSGKFITAFLRNEEIKNSLADLLGHRDGLVGGICNGFQALIKLGLVPYGKIITPKGNSPTLTYNNIGRHQSKIVQVRVCSNKSPWLSACHVGDIFNVAISHGEGRFVADEGEIKLLASNGQIATQYVDTYGLVSGATAFNPNGSMDAIEGITSPDGRVFGKMGHSERIGDNLYKNVSGEYDMKIFESAVNYFKI